MIFGFSIVLLLVIALGIYNYMMMNNVNKTTEDVLKEELPLLIADEQLAAGMHSRIGAVRGYLLSGDQVYREIFNYETEEALAYQEVVKNIVSTEAFDQLIQNTIEWREYIIEEVFNEYDRGNEEQALQNLINSDSLASGLANRYSELAVNRENQIIELEEEILASGKTTLNIGIIVTIAVVMLTLIIAVITSNSIARPVRTVMNRMSLIAGGDLSAEPLEVNSRDEIAQLVTATNELNRSTREVLSQINTVSKTVTGQSE